MMSFFSKSFLSNKGQSEPVIILSMMFLGVFVGAIIVCYHLWLRPDRSRLPVSTKSAVEEHSQTDYAMQYPSQDSEPERYVKSAYQEPEWLRLELLANTSAENDAGIRKWNITFEEDHTGKYRNVAFRAKAMDKEGKGIYVLEGQLNVLENNAVSIFNSRILNQAVPQGNVRTAGRDRKIIEQAELDFTIYSSTKKF